PEQAIRIELGDTDVTPTVQQRAFEMLGFSINKSERRFRPAQSTQPTGSAEFRLDRQSTVSVLVNGTLTQQLNLRPGNYQLRDLPLVTGANAVELAITDDLGNQRSIDFASYFDTALLAAGKDEWEVAAGAQSYLSNNQRGYDTGELLASGFYRRGLTDELTGEAHIQADEIGLMGGASALMQSSLGVFRLNAATSSSQFGSGASVGGAWDLINFVGITGKRGESIHIEGDYRTEDFYVPGLYVDNASGVFFPQQDYRMRVSGSYSAILKYGITASVSGRYIWANDTANLVSRNTVRGDRYGADLTLSAPLGPDLNGGITVGYSNETYLRSFEFVDSPDPEFRFGMRMFWRPDRQSNVIASHDTINDHSTVTAYRNSGTGLNRWNVSVNAHHAQSDDLVNASGAVSYYGNRGEVSVTHLSDVSNISSSSAAPRLTTQRTLVRAGSSIAFADGQVAVGPPIYGDAFAIVYPHDSLSGNDIDVTHGGTVSAKADGWGAAVVTAVPVYYPNAITVDVADLPIGYSLGAGAFDTFAPYKGGYALQVGSDNAISIYGTLVDAGGQPIELLTGSAYAVSSPSRKLTVFTNAAGRFGAEGLAPGRWAIEMATANGPTKYLIDIPDGAGDLVRVGTLSPSTHSEL
ncbi:MAG: fimbrial biogenesis outer membrane usher protein, partial [Pseudomonadota bacterium]